MKRLLFLLLIFPQITNAQLYQRTDTGFSNVFTTNKSSSQVYTKSKEWIATHFKSANDVVQLDTSNKIIVNGNISFEQKSGSYNTRYYGNIRLTVSIKEGRYKIDLDLIRGVKTLAPPNSYSWLDMACAYEYTKEEYLALVLKQFDTPTSRAMLTKRQIEKAKKEVIATSDRYFSEYRINKGRFDKVVNKIFVGIKQEIEAEEEDW